MTVTPILKSMLIGAGLGARLGAAVVAAPKPPRIFQLGGTFGK